MSQRWPVGASDNRRQMEAKPSCPPMLKRCRSFHHALHSTAQRAQRACSLRSSDFIM
jgi:hypothetical protein